MPVSASLHYRIITGKSLGVLGYQIYPVLKSQPKPSIGLARLRFLGAAPPGARYRSCKHAASISGRWRRNLSRSRRRRMRLASGISKLPNLSKDPFRVVVRPGGGLDVRLCSQHKVCNALTMAARLPPSATEEDIVCSNSMQNIFVVSTPQEKNALAYCTIKEIILTEQRHTVATYLTPPGHSCRGVIRCVDVDFTDADLQRMLRTPCNPTVLGARRIKNTTTVVILFNGLKVPNYVYCGPIMYRCPLYKRQIDTCRNCGRVVHRQDVCPHPTEKVCDQCGHRPPGPDHVCSAPNVRPDLPEPLSSTLPREAPSPTPSTSQQEPFVTGALCKPPTGSRAAYTQSTPTRAVQPQEQATPGSSRAPYTCKPTWVDKVTGKGETRAPTRSCSLPQPVTDKIQALEREKAFLRKELSEIKALLKTPPPREKRDSNASEPPAASNEARGAKKRAGPALEAEEPLTMSSIIAHMTALLEQFSVTSLQGEHLTSVTLPNTDADRAEQVAISLALATTDRTTVYTDSKAAAQAFRAGSGLQPRKQNGLLSSPVHKRRTNFELSRAHDLAAEFRLPVPSWTRPADEPP
ncbi:hypothetical protein HPB50_012234 [Hyalomma asiaticum]|uniref:Uncharacterized protein n=1 Tax=Hyalomma asiaticum TaxID=266040 RepID=A0ACB7RQM6_HYAAI|nr:hypothetical protein HPB50_012234 [Hyalomma asiaticum]